MLGWIRSFDTEEPYEPREVHVLGHVASGKRDDYVWAKLSPRLERGEAGNPEPLEVVLLAPRHAGDRLRRKSHRQYMCTLGPFEVSIESLRMRLTQRM